LELARLLDESKQYEQSKICIRIKELLKDKILQGKVTEKWIENCLPKEYKRKYADGINKNKSEVTSLLIKQCKKDTTEEKQLEKDAIAMDTKGDAVLNSAADNNAYFNQRYEALVNENIELQEVVQMLTPIQTADQISSTETGFTIRKEKYEEVKAAIQSSKDCITVVFDKNGTLLHAKPDIFRGNKNDC
jgi:acid phosphatase class B